MTERRLVPYLVYAALSAAIVSSLGLLLVPTLAREFDVSSSTAQWTLTINLLVGAVATPVVGRLSDGRWKRRVLIGALMIVFVGAIVAATATTFAVLLVGRAMLGFSYSITPVTISLARRYAPAENRQSAIAALSVTVATGVGLGYPLTGIIASTTNFRFAFWFAALFVATAIAAVVWAVPAAPDELGLRRKFDTPGAALLGLGLACLLLGISEGARWGWASGISFGVFGAAVALFTAWAWRELAVDHPLVRLDLLRRPEVLLANLTAISLGVSMYIGLSVISLIAQTPRSTGYGVALPLFWAGFTMLPMSIGSQVASRVFRRLSARLSFVTLLPIGAFFVAVANLVMFARHDRLWELLVGMLLFGLGIGTTYAAMPGLISRGVAAQELGSAVSFNQVLRTVGGSIGSAVAGAILAAHISADREPTGHGIDLTFLVSGLTCTLVFAALTVNALGSGLARRRAAELVPITPETEAI